jgi:hypothetical protein
MYRTVAVAETVDVVVYAVVVNDGDTDIKPAADSLIVSVLAETLDAL